jgi:hypothetical protein
MSLSPQERRALEIAVEIANAVPGDDAVRVALTALAQVICGDDPCARYALAAQMLDCADELTGLRWAALCNGRSVAVGERV